jgi:hypothetical protein
VKLTESCEAYAGSVGLPLGFTKKDGSASDQLFLAMTYQRLGRPDEARTWLAKGVAWIKVVEKGKGPTTTGPTVWQRAEWELFRREAEQLIGKK